jgi:hypothetical protein
MFFVSQKKTFFVLWLLITGSEQENYLLIRAPKVRGSSALPRWDLSRCCVGACECLSRKTKCIKRRVVLPLAASCGTEDSVTKRARVGVLLPHTKISVAHLWKNSRVLFMMRARLAKTSSGHPSSQRAKVHFLCPWSLCLGLLGGGGNDQEQLLVTSTPSTPPPSPEAEVRAIL